MKTNIVLIGFMGVGKTTVGEILAKKLGYEFIDSDAAVIAYLEMSPEEIFETVNEKDFRKVERDLIKEIALLQRYVISTGGGTTLDLGNMKNLKQNGIIILLNGSMDTICRNVANGNERPLLKDGNIRDNIENLIKQREDAYKNYDFKVEIDHKSPDMIADLIIHYLKLKHSL